MTTSPDLIIYGGAFDPPHRGHIQFVETAHRRFPGALIAIVPNQTPPPARGSQKKTAASFEQRLKMCELAFAPALSEGWLVIDPIENELPEPNYTFNTVEHIHRRTPEAKLGFMLGQDQLKSFDAWHRPKEILEVCDLIAIARDSAPPPTDVAQSLKKDAHQLLANLGLKVIDNTDSNMIKTAGECQKVWLIDETVCEAQSRLIRADVGSKTMIHSDWLSQEVAEWITQNSLYSH
jgi:nicotinate-nucleotide adenylyltransferase